MNYTSIYKFLAFWWLIIFTNGILAQSVTLKADRDKILIGEQINLLLKADHIKGITQWINLPDSINHIEVVKRSEIDTLNLGGNQIYQQTITITSFDSGHWQIPELSVVDANNQVYMTAPVEVDVIPVDVSQMQDYHDIKEILEVEESSPYFILIIIAIITLASLAIVYWLMRKKKRVILSPPKITENLSPIEWARTELDKLQQENLADNMQIKQHYQQLTNIARRFFYLELGHQSLHQTSDEWMISLQPLPINMEVKTSFLQLLRLADTVKFAKYLPPAYENEQSVKTARQMIELTADWHRAVIFSPNKKS